MDPAPGSCTEGQAGAPGTRCDQVQQFSARWRRMRTYMCGLGRSERDSPLSRSERVPYRVRYADVLGRCWRRRVPGAAHIVHVIASARLQGSQQGSMALSSRLSLPEESATEADRANTPDRASSSPESIMAGRGARPATSETPSPSVAPSGPSAASSPDVQPQSVVSEKRTFSDVAKGTPVRPQTKPWSVRHSL